MFGPHYFGSRYFGPSYWGTGSNTPSLVDTGLLGGGPGRKKKEDYTFIPAWQRRAVEKIDEQIEQAESRQAAADARLESERLAKNEAREQRAILARTQEEIRALIDDRARLIRQITDEEETLLILHSLPFIH